jgi:thiol-disulfide isomerase/thioredoxin
MKYILLSLICLSSFVVNAQTEAQKKIPPFKILLSNGTYFTPDNLDKKKPVVLIYFAPDCDHCRILLSSFFKNVTAFKQAEVVMITFKPIEEVNRFVLDHAIGKYPNIKVGTEGNTFFIRYFYKLTNTPFVALFKNNGELDYAYRTITNVDDLIVRLNAKK